jgi:acyl-homoserine lactone acylase PvdQ
MIKKYIATFLVGFFVLWYITPHVFIQIGRLRADVSIYRDGQGIARVTAHYLPDLFYAIGASLARDRLWSLYELKKRVEGQASSVIGSSELSMDKFIRSLNIKETVKGRPTNE